MNLHEEYANQIEGKRLVKSMLSGKAYKLREECFKYFSGYSIYFCKFWND